MFTASKFLSLAAIVGLSSPVALAAPTVHVRDVYAPPVTYPHAGTVWYSGQHHNVTWDNSNPPKQITNPIGKIFLRKDGLTNDVNALAEGFNLTQGRVEIQVPWVEDGGDYQIVLFGDSGNFSPKFTIHSE